MNTDFGTNSDVVRNLLLTGAIVASISTVPLPFAPVFSQQHHNATAYPSLSGSFDFREATLSRDAGKLATLGEFVVRLQSSQFELDPDVQRVISERFMEWI